jgi:hypothetical protein
MPSQDQGRESNNPKDKACFCVTSSMSVFGRITSALGPRADVNRDTCSRRLLTRSGHANTGPQSGDRQATAASVQPW